MSCFILGNKNDLSNMINWQSQDLRIGLWLHILCSFSLCLLTLLEKSTGRQRGNEHHMRRQKTYIFSNKFTTCMILSKFYYFSQSQFHYWQNENNIYSAYCQSCHQDVHKQKTKSSYKLFRKKKSCLVKGCLVEVEVILQIH